MIRLQAKILAFRIEYHWRCVGRNRAAMERLLRRGVMLDAPQMLRRNRRLTKHMIFLMKAERFYETYLFPRVWSVL